MCSTAKMGKPDDKTASTNLDYRLRGVKNLRIVDLSIMPHMTRQVLLIPRQIETNWT
jgi:choline dehydrogenase-like flavoprotein